MMTASIDCPALPIKKSAVAYSVCMLILPIKTPLLKSGDDLASILFVSAEFQPDDIVVVSSKAVATVEGAAIDLSTIMPTAEARELNSMKHKSDAYCQALLDEMHRMHGTVAGRCPLAILTCLRPDGLPQGILPIANAGLDVSNVEKGFAIGWPREPVRSVRILREELLDRMRKQRNHQKEQKSTKISKSSEFSVAVILGDSFCMPARFGVIALALTVCGIDPFIDNVGRKDLFGNAFSMTREATADQLCTAANFVMGNTSECTPAAIIRNHHLSLSEFCGWVPGIEPDEDLFRDMFLRPN